jgi:co-chaperonin GroES (HSP10)
MTKKISDDVTGSNASLPELRELMPKFVPWDGHIGIRPLYERQSVGGIIIPDTARESALVYFCLVTHVAPGVRRCKAGDIVLVHRSAPVRRIRWQTASEEQNFEVMEESGILGTFAPPPEGYEPDVSETFKRLFGTPPGLLERAMAPPAPVQVNPRPNPLLS